jgi:hypothetical protein
MKKKNNAIDAFVEALDKYKYWKKTKVIGSNVHLREVEKARKKMIIALESILEE